MNHEERLGKSPFTGLPNVKGTVAEDARITDSPPRSEPVLEIRVRPRAGMLRCSRCGRRCRGHDQGGVVVASVPWAEPGSRSTRDFESERAWPMSVANQKTVSGFPHVAWRAAGRRRP